MKRAGIQLVRHVWQHNDTTAWETLNHSLYCALQIGIASGMKFDPKDFAEIEAKYRPSYWLGEHGFERPYADAIVYDNRSFIEAFEQWAGRKPFLANNVKPAEPYPKLIHRIGTRARGRLAMWFKFGVGWKVTSIKGDILIAVREALPNAILAEEQKRTVRRFTHADLREMFPAPKKTKPEQAETEA